MKKWKQFEYTKDPDKILSKIKGKPYRKYRENWQKASKCTLVQTFPIHIDFELHYGCNLQCPQCILQIDSNELDSQHPYRKENRRKKISFEKFKEVIDEGLKHGLSSITLGVNNEPLMNPNVDRYIAYAHKRGVLDIIVITNATLLTTTLSRKLLESGITKLYFSVDAISEGIYSQIRKGGNYKLVIENILYFLALKKKMKKQLPITRVSFVKSKINEHEEEAFQAFWKDKVDFVSIQAFYSPAVGYSHEENLKTNYQIANTTLKSAGPCPQPYQRFTIYCDGSVHPCCHWFGATLTVGNINEKSIYSIWNSQKMKTLRKNVNSARNAPKECIMCRSAVFGVA